MFLDVLGFIAAVLSLIGASMGMFLVAFNCLGKYDIGGVQNPLPTKIVIILGIALLGFSWVEIFALSPFSITLS